MRPIDKGIAPQEFLAYGDAQPHLIEVLGRFCSYCGRFIAAGIAVEHKRPKTRYPAGELLWSNYLLACPNCNSCKGHPKVRLRSYLWPDSDNTLRAIHYTEAGQVRASRMVSKRIRRLANRTIRMLGLDQHPGTYHLPSDRDYRWQDRRDQWEMAMLFRQQLQEYDTPAQRSAAATAASKGIFSIWWRVFEGDADMRRRLRLAFPGTAAVCFDANEELVPRVGGKV